ncbi:MAG: helix-turn-helix domain-containing protein [Coriobacteriales bacterium]|nr:helix-turn-helix domain-containing protein [Coriobacteriales bacterium]
MAEATFGERLAEARRIKSETIEEVSEQLRIRPSIILAMETSNFSHMPHKGYARNMVSSYARYLGLDSTRITEQFLREFRRWESTGKSGARSVSSHANSYTLAARRGGDPDDQILESERQESGREMITAAKRNKERSSVWGKGNSRDNNRMFREQLRQAHDVKDTGQSRMARRPSVRRIDANAPTGTAKQVRTNDYKGKPPKTSLLSGLASQLTSKPVLMIIGLVLAFLAILILWAVLASTCSHNDTTNAPVTGVASSDEGLDEDQASNNVEDIEAQVAENSRYGPFELVVEVVEGASWLRIEVDGSTPVGDVCTAPWTGTYTVSSACTIEAGAPGYVRAYKNGIEVPLDNVDGLGLLELEVEQRPIVQNAQNADAASQE